MTLRNALLLGGHFGAYFGAAMALACSGTSIDARPHVTATDTADAASIDSALPLGDSGLNLSVDATAPGKAPVGNRVLLQGNVPADAEHTFAGATPAAGQGPTLVYPTPETMFPPNIARILFQWSAAPGNLFRLHFDTGQQHLDVYTDGAHATCTHAGTPIACWESSALTLLPYLDAAAGGAIKLRIDALDPAQPATLKQSSAYTLYVSAKRVGGAIYYWSTTAQGVRRGTLDGRDAGNYVTPKEAKGQCVACHTLSRSGKRLSIALPGDLLGLVDVVETTPPVTFGPSSQGFPGSNISASWATFSPDETKIVVAGQGVMTVRNATTAQAIGGPLALPTGVTGSMPDWAPDGKHLVFASSLDAPLERLARHLQGSSIAWLSAAGDGFTGFEFIAEAKGVAPATCVGRESYANPMFSPDSKWLAFSRGNCESEGDASSVIILAAAQPNGAQNPITRANTQVGDKALQNLQNGMPTWAPASDDKIGWIAFTSTRDYGKVLAEGSLVGTAMRQLWVAAVDFSKLGSGDPSYPAFRLPAQDLTENNHRPFWTLDVLPPDWVPADVR